MLMSDECCQAGIEGPRAICCRRSPAVIFVERAVERETFDLVELLRKSLK